MEPLDLSSCPIGIFDSGFGGLTVMRAVRELLPKEHILYLGDAARLPYGNKSRDTIIRYTLESSRFLVQQKIKLLVIACHTASAQALADVVKDYPFPVVGMVAPSLPDLKSSAAKGGIAILGTQGTIHSNIYQKLIQNEMPAADIMALACPLFVPLVEEGLIESSIAQESIKHYLQDLKEKQIKSVLLACTHYPLLKTAIQNFLGEDCRLIDPAINCAAHVKDLLQSQDLLNKEALQGHSHFYTTDDPEKFKRLGEKFLGSPILTVEQVTF